MDKIKVLLFAMTGFGNAALKVLTRDPSVKLIGVVTPRRQNAYFPYYECEGLQEVALKSGIALYEDLTLNQNRAYQLIKTLSPILIVASSFNQIIPENVISIPKLGVINIHPSLLPKYRGATPTVWALMNGEKETGITVHFIEDERIDSGRIIIQNRLKIRPSDNDGTLRHRLAELSEKALSDALDLILTKDKNMFPLQNESEVTYYPKRMLKDAVINLNRPFKEIVNKIRAMSPYPGAYLKYNGKKYIVKTASLLLTGKTSEDIREIGKEEIMVETSEGIVKFQINYK